MDPLDAYMASIQKDATSQVAELTITPSESRHVSASHGQVPNIPERAAPSSQCVRNRRYRALQSLLKSEYFNDDEMQRRDPALFHEALGAQIEAAILSASSRASMSWAEPVREQPVLPRESSSDIVSEQNLQGARIGLQLGFGAGADEDDAGDLSRPLTAMLASATQRRVRTDHTAAEGESNAGDDAMPLADAEDSSSLECARSALVRLMAERFLRGDDAPFFDYAEVDHDDTLDVHNEATDDWEDKYFR
jgi:hypothetical protein